MCRLLYIWDLKLDKLQAKPITKEQRNEVQKIVAELLEQSIKDVERSHVYKERKRNGELFSDRELLREYFSDMIDEIEREDVKKRHKELGEVKFAKNIKRNKASVEENEAEKILLDK